MNTVWEVYEWIAVVAFTFSIVLVTGLFIRSELDIRERKKKIRKFDADLKEIMEQEANRDRFREALGYKEDDDPKEK